jgi:hypothetical protein
MYQGLLRSDFIKMYQGMLRLDFIKMYQGLLRSILSYCPEMIVKVLNRTDMQTENRTLDVPKCIHYTQHPNQPVTEMSSRNLPGG